MTAAERQDQIMATLRSERRVTMGRLAEMLKCNIRTICRDIESLSLSFPLVTIHGRHGGGVELAEWYQPQRATLCPEQLEVLRRLMNSAQPEDRATLGSILDQFGPRR